MSDRHPRDLELGVVRIPQVEVQHAHHLCNNPVTSVKDDMVKFVTAFVIEANTRLVQL